MFAFDESSSGTDLDSRNPDASVSATNTEARAPETPSKSDDEDEVFDFDDFDDFDDDSTDSAPQSQSPSSESTSMTEEESIMMDKTREHLQKLAAIKAKQEVSSVTAPEDKELPSTDETMSHPATESRTTVSSGKAVDERASDADHADVETPSAHKNAAPEEKEEEKPTGMAAFFRQRMKVKEKDS